MENSFSYFLRVYRDELRLTFERLGNIAGLSKQYLHNLENHKLNKNLSFEKLKDVIVLLSQKEVSSEQDKFVTKSKNPKAAASKTGRRKKGEGNPSYYDKKGFPEPSELDLEKFKKMLFVSTGLTKYENSFVPVESIASSKTEIDEYIERNKFAEQKIAELKHTYEVWTLSDILGETLFDESAEKTAEYIIKNKIKYINFVPLDDNTQWRTAYQRIKSFAEKIIGESNKATKDYWTKKDKWENYIHFYGVSNASFFIRLRIYNPYSPNARGNYNVGGKTANTAKFANILSTEIPMIVDRLKLIVFADVAKQFDKGENHLIKELGCYVNKKIITN
jgi:DNA-binding XRE family transcriptional regulator